MDENRLAPDCEKGESENAHVVLIDETGLQLSPLRRRSWAKRGCRPILRQLAGARKRVSVIAALTLSPKTLRRNLFFQTLIDGTFDSTRIAAFLRDLLKHLRGKIIVVWDNGPMHKGPAIRKLHERNPRLTVKHLPPYAPELNPVEALWSHLKYGYCANLIANDLDQLDDEAMNFLVDTKLDQKNLQAYWKQTPLGINGGNIAA